MPVRKKSSDDKIKKELSKASTISEINLTKSYQSLFYGAISVVVLLILVIVGSRVVFNKNNSNTNISDEGISVSSEDGETVGNLVKNYTVVEGDTLWKISEKLYKSGYNWVDLAKANKLTNPDLLFVGAKLTVPEVKAVVVEEKVNNESKQSVEVNTSKKIEGSEYVINKGDDLWDISLRAYGDGYKWVEIAKANKLENPSLIHSGNKLIIPR